MNFNYSEYLVILFGIGIFVGVIAGLYPALYLARVQHQLVLKGKFTHGNQGTRLRNLRRNLA